jgi:tRNA threonylcarbamoyladenosine biosynthesis protein TsaB
MHLVEQHPEIEGSAWILGVDTARKGVSLELFTADGSRQVIRNVANVRGEVISSELDVLLDESGVSLDQVGTLLVALGPGSFTGLRTGIAFCQGLCASGKRRMLGVSSLALLRAQFREPVHGRVGVISLARPGFWYVGLDAEGWPSAAFGAKLPEEEFLETTEAARFLRDAQVIVSDGPRPSDGSLADLPGHWVDESAKFHLSAGRVLLPFLTSSLSWTANYIQPSYAEQARS